MPQQEKCVNIQEKTVVEAVLPLQSCVFFFCEEKHLFKCEYDVFCKRFATKHSLMRHAVVHDHDKKKMKIKIRTFHEESREYISSERKYQQSLSFPTKWKR